MRQVRVLLPSKSSILAVCCLLAPAVLRGQAGPRHLPGTTPDGAPSTGPVRVSGGLVAGSILPDGVRSFRGIPFAAPPVGKLRWREPQPAHAWRGVRTATRFGPQCMQPPIFGDMVFRSDGMSEDCLYLNVWAPAPARTAGRRQPVLLYFFGGGFVAGDGSELRYDGASLARHGIIVVTTNYRLGAFGFLAHPELTRESPHHSSGNYGLLDQAAALAWVRRNIAAFGGDPHRITIGGESAGSISVCAQMASPLSRQLIAGAIGESGGMIGGSLTPVPLAEAERLGVVFAGSVGAESLAALRALPAESLLAASGRPGQGRFPSAVDGWFFPSTPEEVFAAGRQARVPLLVGWNTQEASWRALFGTREPTPQDYAAVVDSLYGANAAELLRLLPGTSAQQVMESAMLLAGSRFIAFGTWKWAELHHASGRRVYRYLYARPRPATVAPASGPPPDGAVHSAEIEYALGNLATNDVYAWTPADDSLSALMQSYFANFVKTGDPNGAGLPSWPAAYAGDSTRVMILDARLHAEPAQHEDVFRLLDRIHRAGDYRSRTKAP